VYTAREKTRKMKLKRCSKNGPGKLGKVQRKGNMIALDVN
jgi:hypothetical protein